MWSPLAGELCASRFVTAHLLNVLLHPVIVAIHAVPPDVGLLRHELSGLRDSNSRAALEGRRGKGSRRRSRLLTMRSNGILSADTQSLRSVFSGRFSVQRPTCRFTEPPRSTCCARGARWSCSPNCTTCSFFRNAPCAACFLVYLASCKLGILPHSKFICKRCRVASQPLTRHFLFVPVTGPIWLQRWLSSSPSVYSTALWRLQAPLWCLHSSSTR